VLFSLYTTEQVLRKVDPKVPVDVFIDKGSASATEIFTSTLRDNCHSLVVGERSYGKGLIQTSIGLEDVSRLIVTAGRYLRPNGREIQGRGINADTPGRGIIASFNESGERSNTSYSRLIRPRLILGKCPQDCHLLCAYLQLDKNLHGPETVQFC
jgi:C-terminal processing protease CtpA/Prc